MSEVSLEDGDFGPHLVDGGREREAKRVRRDGLTRFEARGAEREVCIDPVPVLPAPCWLRRAFATKIVTYRSSFRT